MRAESAEQKRAYLAVGPVMEPSDVLVSYLSLRRGASY